MEISWRRVGFLSALGVIAVLLFVFALGGCAARAYGQDSELPSQIKGASPYPDSVVCKGWMMFESGEYDRRIADSALSGSMSSVRDRLRVLCGKAPDDENVGADSAAWLAMVDGVFESITTALLDRMGRPVSAKDRVVIQNILQSTAIFQRDFEILRTQAYASETVRVVESVKTVEVPTRCLEPAPIARPIRSNCEEALHDSLTSWHDGLYRKQDQIFGMPVVCGSGCEDEEWANGVRDDINRVSSDSLVAPRVLGWLASYRTMHRDRRGMVDARYERVASDMRAKLRYCGVYSEER